MSENTDAAEGATTLVAVSPPPVPGDPPEEQPQLSAGEQDAVRALVRQARASGHGRKFVGGSGPGGGVAQVEAAGGVEGVFGGSAPVAGGQVGVFVVLVAGAVDGEAPVSGGAGVAQSAQA
jgi:hypothetical protein